MPETQPARFSTASVDPPSEFPSGNLPFRTLSMIFEEFFCESIKVVKVLVLSQESFIVDFDRALNMHTCVQVLYKCS